MNARKLAIILCTCITALTIYHYHANASLAGNNDLELLLRAAPDFIQEDAQVTVKAYAELQDIPDRPSFLARAQHFSDELGLSAQAMDLSDNVHVAYQSHNQSSDGISVKLRMMMTGRHSGALILTLASDMASSTISQWQSLQQYIQQLFQKEKISLQWYATIEGESALAAERLWEQIPSYFQAEEIEAYEDVHTEIVSFYSPRLKNTIRTGEKTMNLQVAHHDNPHQLSYTIKLGTPLITTP